MYNVGIMGLGHWYWAFNLARALTEYPKAKLVAVSSPRENILEEFTNLFGVKAYSDYNELLLNEKIDIVLIVPPVANICEYAVAAAKAGKHILLGKPMAMTLEEANQIVKAVNEAKVKALPLDAFVKLTNSKVKKQIEDGEIGDIVYFGSTCHTSMAEDWYRSGVPGWFADPKQVPGGALLDEGIYNIQLLRFLAGSEVKEINYARIANLVHTDIDVEDFGLGNITFKNNIIARIEASWTTVNPQRTNPSPKEHGYNRLEIIGTKGKIILDSIPFTYQAILGKNYPCWTYIRGLLCPKAEACPPPGYDFINPPLNHLIDCIEKDIKPIGTCEDAKNSLEVGLAMYKSAKEGKPVSLPLTI